MSRAKTRAWIDVAKRIVKRKAPVAQSGVVQLKGSEYRALVYTINEEKFKKYRNPDPRCTYPFDPSPLGYCWSFAQYVDDGWSGLKRGKEKGMETICKGCECWKPK